MYLLDTNVLSADAPGRQNTADWNQWVQRYGHHLYLSVITIAEIEDGIAKARRGAAVRKANRLAIWLDAVLHLYAGRILPLDLASARILGGLSDQARSAGHAPGFADLGIAATAKSRGYTVLTRNLRHFRPLNVAVMDPFDTLPTGA